MSINGKILKQKDSETGIYVSHMTIDVQRNQIRAKVCYFSLDQIGKRGGWAKEVTRDNKFIIPQNEFLNDYLMLENPDNLKSKEEAIWIPITGLETEER